MDLVQRASCLSIADMKSYGQFCPVAQALELVGDRWSLLIIRELVSGSRRFSEILNGVRRIPRSLLVARLEQLEEAGLVSRGPGAHNGEYRPTKAALALEPILMQLGAWSRDWAHRRIRDD
ncbi:MAG TPA: helix-turn-helix domain-containing protein, partial [Polyangiaceae bacterium]|nr:helix-turn-helix domain-containing protein [Polyangiaceae bacterium]